MHNLSEGCSKEAGEGSSAKRPRGRLPKIRDFHDDVGLAHFVKAVLALDSNCSFHRYLDTVHRTIILKTNSDCYWTVKVKDMKGTISMNQGGLDLPLHMKSRSTTHHLQGAQG
jgi:hypothetical protein